MRSQLPALGLVMMIYGIVQVLFCGVLWCTVPVAILDGEEIPTMVLAVLWGCAIGVTGLLMTWAGWRLRKGRGRVLALVVLLMQAPLMFCWCTLPSLGLMLWGGFLLLVDRDAIDAIHDPGWP